MKVLVPDKESFIVESNDYIMQLFNKSGNNMIVKQTKLKNKTYKLTLIIKK